MKRLVAAFFNSLAGLRYGLMREEAIRQELILALVSVPAALLLTHEPWKLLALWSSILLIVCAELLNTGIERIADRVTQDRDELVRIAKDCGSAAVLMAILIAAGTWGLVLFEFLSSREG
jgi:diacylglycerol kinase (ATP)